MSFVATAIVGGAVIGAGGSYLAGRESRKGMEKAANVQGDTIDKQLAALAPFREAGYLTLPYLMQMMGIPIEAYAAQPPGTAPGTAPVVTYDKDIEKAPPFMQDILRRKFGGRVKSGGGVYPMPSEGIPSDLSQLFALASGKPLNIQASPMYNLRAELGERGINRALASRGLFNSGAGLETLSSFYNALGADEAEKVYDRLLNLVNIGQGHAGESSRAIGAGGANLANLAVAGGQNSANTVAGISNALTGGLQNYYTYNLLKPGGGGVYGISDADMAMGGKYSPFDSGGFVKP